VSFPVDLAALQSEELIERFNAPSSLTALVRRLWFAYLESWRQDGWGSDAHLRKKPLGLKIYLSDLRDVQRQASAEAKSSTTPSSSCYFSDASEEPNRNPAEIPPRFQQQFPLIWTSGFQAKSGELAMVLSLSLLYMALRTLRFPIFARDLRIWVNHSELSFYNARTLLQRSQISRIDGLCPGLHRFFAKRGNFSLEGANKLVAARLSRFIDVRPALSNQCLNLRALAYRVVAEFNLPARFASFVANLCELRATTATTPTTIEL
jgi:hypothetical protein